METLDLDRDEVRQPHEKRWVYRERRNACIEPNENALWLVEVEQSWLHPPRDETHTEEMFRSPGDALAYAESMGNGARRDGVGVWTLEVYGDGENGPKMLRVRPTLDLEGAES